VIRAARGGVRCALCPLRQRDAFKPKSAEEIAFVQGMKMEHRLVPAGGEIIHHGKADAELFTLFSGWAFRHKTLEMVAARSSTSCCPAI
jgi:hypothetical protein